MTRVDFYILPEDEHQQRLAFVCRLVEKAYKQQHRIYIHTPNAAASEELDLLLWTFKVESFVPHHIAGDGNPPAPVTIGHGDDCDDHHDVIINLGDEIPDFFSRFERCIEVVIQQEEILQKTREHFAFYKERGYPLKTHDLRK